MKPSVITVDPEIMSGGAVLCRDQPSPGLRLTGRVPVQSLFDYLDGRHPLADFLEDFPTVTAAQAHQLLAEAKVVLI